MKLTKQTSRAIFLLATSIVIMCAIVWNISEVFGVLGGILTVFRPVIIGICLAFILNILMSFFEDKLFFALKRENKKGKKHLRTARTLSVLMTLVVFFGIISLLLLVIIPQVSDTAAKIAAGFPAFIDRSIKFMSGILRDFNITSERISEILLGGEHALEQLGSFVKDNFNGVMLSVKTVGGSVISTVVSILLGLFITIYFLFQKDLVLGQLRRFFQAVMKRTTYNTATHILHISTKSFSNFIGGQLIEACILGLLCFIGMLIFRFPFAPVVSVLVGVTALVPILGAWIGCVISAALILINDPVKAFWFIIFFLVLQQIEGNLIYPRVVGKQVGLPGVWVLLAVLIGNGFFGALGALVAVPVSSVLYTLLAEFVNYRETKKAEVKHE